jgi:hypothetical protein
MADNNEDSIRRETEARDASTKGVKQLAGAIEDLIERNKSAEDKFKKLNKELDTGKKRLVDIGPALEDLRESIDKVADAGQKAALTKDLERKESQAKSAQYNRLIADSAMSLASGLASAGINITKSVINSYQSNASAFQTAGDIAVAGIDATNQTVKGFAGAANVAGAGLMFLGPKGIAAGVALQGIATGAIFLSEKFSDLAKFGINVAVKELENTTKNFAAASAAGALFSQGMGEMRRSATDAGLTQEQFAKVIAENAGTFAMFGGSVGAGAQQFSRINKAMLGYQTGLIKLGYSIEDIADGTAQYMAIMAASGQGNRRDYANLAKETDAYLTNLRVIAAFTGEDAKKKMEQARNASMQLAIDTRIRNMEATGDTKARERFMGTIGILPEKMQKAAMQIAEVGSITDPDLAAAFYNNKEAMMVLNDAATLFKTSNLSAAEATQKMIATQKVASQTAFDSNKDFNKAVGTSTLAINANAGVSSAAEEASRYLLKKQTDDAKTATATANDQKNNTDTLSVSTAKAVEAMQGLRIEIQDKLTVAITKFATFIPKILEGIDKQLRDAGINIDTPPTTLGANKKPVMAPQAPAPGTPGSELKRDFRGNPIPQTPTSPGRGTVSANGLKIKPGYDKEEQQGNAKIMELAQQVHTMLGGNYKYFSGFKDRGIDDSPAHGSGRAFDLVLNDLKQYPEVVAKLRSMGGFSKVLDESIKPANPEKAKEWGPHLHAEVAAAQGAVVPATTGGVNVKVAEGGASEVIAPLKNGRLPGMDEMIDRLDQMISVLKDHRDTSEKIFNATA